MAEPPGDTEGEASAAHQIAPRDQELIQELVREQVVQAAAWFESFSGPLPPPKHLAEYERILPGAAERIFRMAEDQATHRRSLEQAVVMGDVTGTDLPGAVGSKLDRDLERPAGERGWEPA